jgi:hypothetical protein
MRSRPRTRSDFARSTWSRPRPLRGAYQGNLDALRWVMGDLDRSPGSHQVWPTRAPTAEQIDAEHHCVVGRVYDNDQTQDQIPHGGAETALWWGLGRE